MEDVYVIIRFDICIYLLPSNCINIFEHQAEAIFKVFVTRVTQAVRMRPRVMKQRWIYVHVSSTHIDSFLLRGWLIKDSILTLFPCFGVGIFSISKKYSQTSVCAALKNMQGLLIS